MLREGKGKVSEAKKIPIVPCRFRQQYCKLWEAMFLLDVKTLDEICKQWVSFA